MINFSIYTTVEKCQLLQTQKQLKRPTLTEETFCIQ